VANTLGLKDVTYIPISSLKGDNIVKTSKNTSWYKGPSLLDALENVKITNDTNLDDARFAVQYVIRPQTEELHDYRGYAGKVLSGIYKKGDDVTILPSGQKSKVKSIEIAGNDIPEAFAGQSIVIQIEDNIDISRGDAIVNSNNLPKLEKELEALVCWMDDKPLQIGNRYLLQTNSTIVQGIITGIKHKLDVNTLEKNYYPTQAFINEIVLISLKTASPIAFDSYEKIRANGGAILIDETSNTTVGALLLQ
jgi:sulfate adenylyltransferase subunit 1